VPPRAETATARAWAATGIGERVSAYAELSKFGIVLLVLVSAAAGFMLRAPLGADFPWAHGLVVLAGVMLLSSGASALNQVQERRRDALMARTANRPLPSGRLSYAQGLVFAAVATAAGAAVLWLGIGRTAGVLGITAAVFYNGVYTPWLKPTSPFAAVPGAIPGSIPPVIGWSAAGGYTATTFGFMLLVGFGEGNWGCIGPLLNEVFPTSVRAAALGIIYNTARGVQFLAPVIIGMVAARFTFGAGIALAVPFALLAGAMVWTLPETKGVRLMSELTKATV